MYLMRWKNFPVECTVQAPDLTLVRQAIPAHNVDLSSACLADLAYPWLAQDGRLHLEGANVELVS